MAGDRYIDLVSDAETITQLTGERAFVRRLANQILAHICGLHEWPFLWTTSWFQTIAAYATGTVALTEGSPTVTGTNTTFTSAMVGRKIRFGSETGYYTIKSFTSTTSITLDQNYTGSTTTSTTFSIYKDEYLLRGDVDTQKRIRQSENGIALFSLSATEFDEWYPSPSSQGIPSADVFQGKGNSTYSTGTVSLPASSRTLTGSSTAWTGVEGLGKGTKLKIGTSIFTVNTVDSDTAITLYEANGSTAVSAGTTYTAILDNYVVSLHAIPDEVFTMFYRFQRIPFIMDADNDVPDLPYPMHPLVRLGMLPMMYRLKGQAQKAVEAQTSFETDLERWRQKYALPVLDQKRPLHPFSLQRDPIGAPWNANTGIPLRF